MTPALRFRGVLARGKTLPLLLPILVMTACGGGALAPRPTPTPISTLRDAGDAKGIIVGAAAQPQLLSEAPYAATLRTEYRQLQPENAMKFGPIHPRPNTDAAPYDFNPADQLVAFAQQNGMRVRGHTFVWHRQIANWLTAGIANGTYGAADLNSILQDHIATVLGHYAGRVYAWDVVNEAFNDDGTMRSSPWYDAPGIGFAGQHTAYIEQALRWARAADPAAKLFYNDYNAETLNAKSDTIYRMASDFKQRGVPLDGIGFQLHVHLSFADPNTLNSFTMNLKRFSELGMEIHLTEFDVALDAGDAQSLAAEGDLYKKVTLICMQNPNCKMLQTWGFTDKYSWIPAFTNNKQGWALPFDLNYNKKPAYDGMLNALTGK